MIKAVEGRAINHRQMAYPHSRVGGGPPAEKSTELGLSLLLLISQKRHPARLLDTILNQASEPCRQQQTGQPKAAPL